ncbi:uncharacterized protein LOC144169465 isoform X2 [Haemaphysalis longicornis]
MRHLIGAACVLAFIGAACTANVIPAEEEPSFEVVVENESKRIGEEAILVGRLLVETAREIDLDEELKSGNDEYFVKHLYNKTAEVVKRVGKKLKDMAGRTFTNVKTVTKDAYDRATQKALRTLLKVFSNNMAGYAMGNYETQGEFVISFCDRVKKVGQSFIARGNQLTGQ